MPCVSRTSSARVEPSIRRGISREDWNRWKNGRGIVKASAAARVMELNRDKDRRRVRASRDSRVEDSRDSRVSRVSRVKARDRAKDRDKDSRVDAAASEPTPCRARVRVLAPVVPAGTSLPSKSGSFRESIASVARTRRHFDVSFHVKGWM